MAKKMIFKKVEPSSRMEFKKVKPKFNFKVLPSNRLFSKEVIFSPTDKAIMSYERNLDPSYNVFPGPEETEKLSGWQCNINHKSGTATSDQLVENNYAISKIFLGGVYDIKDLVAGNANTLPYARKPIGIMVDSHHFKTATAIVENPTKLNVRDAVNRLIRSKDFPDIALTIGKISQFDSFSSLLTNFSGSGHYLGFGGSHKISFDSNRKTHKFYLEVKQEYYRMSVNNDLHEPDDFFFLKEDDPDKDGAVPNALVNPNWVYVDSVGYGRMLFFVFESDESYQGMDIDLKQYADYLAVGIELNERIKEKVKDQKVSMQVVSIGGTPLIAPVLLGTETKSIRESIKEYFNTKNDEVPISYSLSTIDNQMVGTHLFVDYKSRQCYPVPTKYQVIWDSITCRVNDDGGDNEQVKAFVRIRAVDKKGKDIMDEDRINSNLIHHNNLMNQVEQKISNPFWTFIKGSESAPLVLKENRYVSVNKSISFPMKESNPINKIAFRVDILEYDVGPNDNFDDDTFSLKPNEVDPNQTYSATCRHDESEIDFIFRVVPKYD